MVEVLQQCDTEMIFLSVFRQYYFVNALCYRHTPNILLELIFSSLNFVEG